MQSAADFKRIVIIGATGSGKTTFARDVAARGGHAFYDLDDFHWLPGWQWRDRDEFVRLAADMAAGDTWVVSGNYSLVRPQVWSRATMIVWLDYPFLLVFWRLLRRSLRRLVDKRPICNGNTENLRQFLSKDSIMVWLFKSYGKHKKQYAEIFSGGGEAGLYPQAVYIRLTSPDAAAKWLQTLPADAPLSPLSDPS